LALGSLILTAKLDGAALLENRGLFLAVDTAITPAVIAAVGYVGNRHIC